MILLRLPPSLGSLACRRLRASRWVSSVRCMHSDARIDLISTGPEASDRLAEFIASASAPGDAFLLYGEVGAGKSHFRCLWRVKLASGGQWARSCML